MKRYDSYKDSGIEWIGEIPSHWKIMKTSHCFEQIGSGTTPTAGNPEYYENGEFNWLQTGDLTDGEIFETSKRITQKALNNYSALRFYSKDSLVIAMYGATIGKTGFLKIETTTNQACCVLSKPKNLNSRFAFYLLNYIKPHLISLSYGGGQPNINQEQIRNLKINCPPFSEQISIISYLDKKTSEIDRLIANKEELLKLYEEEKTAVINDLVTGKKVWNGNAWTEPVEVKDSGIEWLGEIPEHWEVKKLKYVAHLKSGNNIVSEQIKEIGEYPVFGGNGLRGYFSEYTHDGDHILIGRQGAYCGNIKYGKGKFWASEHAVVLTEIIRYETIFLGELLGAMNLNQYSVSAAQPGLAVDTIKNLSVPFPPIEEQQSIVDFIKSETTRIDAKIEDTQKLIELLKEYRTALISEVVTGKVKVIQD